ncbi:hypothetical protein GCM10009779_23610 [Polymorphospora rubra]|uniref:Uncharacterized protein n=1 Tax=Polymorphospora rubra TaxID=338584 RepID=A0A810NFV6_9ACTN|nr:hypothetical protein Prubr_71460 [Polymorphospora rubra]
MLVVVGVSLRLTGFVSWAGLVRPLPPAPAWRGDVWPGHELDRQLAAGVSWHRGELLAVAGQRSGSRVWAAEGIGRRTGPVHPPTRYHCHVPQRIRCAYAELAVDPNTFEVLPRQILRAPVIISCPATRHAVRTTAEQPTIITHRHPTKGTGAAG